MQQMGTKTAFYTNRVILLGLYEQILDNYSSCIELNKYYDIFRCIQNINNVAIIQCHVVDSDYNETPHADAIFFIDIEKTLEKLQDELDLYFKQSNKILEKQEQNEFECFVLEQLFYYDEDGLIVDDVDYRIYVSDFLKCRFIVFLEID